MSRFNFLYTRISLASLLVEHSGVFLFLVFLFFLGVVIYLAGNDRVKDFLGSVAKFILFGYIIYNMVVAASIAIYLLYQHYV